MATNPVQTGTQTGNLIDNEVVLHNQDMINNSENVTHNAALDNDATNTNTTMANAATDFLPHQDLPPHKFNNHSYWRKMFSTTLSTIH